jgi:hypothetical protein
MIKIPLAGILYEKAGENQKPGNRCRTNKVELKGE